VRLAARLPGPVVLVFMIGLAVGSWWLANRERERADLTADAPDATPAYYLRGAVLEQTDATGRVEIRVTADRAVQDPASRNVRLETLRVDYFLATPARTWVMTAAEGTLPREGRIVLLAGDVRLQGSETGRGEQATIRTERLRLDIDRSLATTDAPVRMELARHALTARGLEADLKADRVQLESEVNGRFTP